MSQEPITSLKGIGEKTGKLFERLGIHTVDELLEYYPRTYDIFEKPVKIVERSIPYPEIYCNSFGARRDRNPHRKIREKRDFDRGGFPSGRGSICRGCGMPGQQAARRLLGGRRGPGETAQKTEGNREPRSERCGALMFC